MASQQDPFEYPPMFLRRLQPHQRLFHALLIPIGVIAAIVASVAFIPSADVVGRGLATSIFLLGFSLLAALLLMALPSEPTPSRNTFTAVGSLTANAALVSVLSLAEMLAIAFLRRAVSDPFAGAAEKFGAFFSAVFITLSTLGIIFAAARKTYELSGPWAPLTLVLTATAALFLYSMSVLTLLGIAGTCLTWSALLLLRGGNTDTPDKSAK